MKKLVSLLAIVLAFTMMMSLTSFAAASFEIKADAPTYEGTTVVPAADSIEVTTATTAGNYYGVLLVEGTALPTVDTDILYIDQVTADATSETLNVLPIIPAANTDVTLYVSSNVAGAELISVPMTYAEEAPAGPNVTLMNGTEAVAAELVTDADGNVTLPAEVAFNKTLNTGYTFTHYSWVDADETVEYLAGAKVAAADLDGKTLYAKYDTGIVIGDINGSNGTIEGVDRTYLHQYISTAGSRKLGNMGKTFAELTGVAGLDGVVGDINGSNGTIEGVDRTYLHQYISTAGSRKLGNMGKAVYYVNK